MIAGPSQTGKTSIIDFIKYCLGDDEHPQHAEVLAKVREATLRAELAGVPTRITRSATGSASRFASVWGGDDAEQRRTTEVPADPESLSQFLLTACDLDNIELPEAPRQAESRTQILSIRDVFRIVCLPNERLDNKNLLFEHAHHMVAQKHQQLINVMFEPRPRAIRAERARPQHPRDRPAPRRPRSRHRPFGFQDQWAYRVLAFDHRLREALSDAQVAAQAARVRVRHRESLVDRLNALRGQYADDKKKLTFLKDAERLFDPLHVTTCPACLSTLASAPAVIGGECTLCGQHLPEDGPLTIGTASAVLDPEVPSSNGQGGPTQAPRSTAVLEAELRATTRRLSELNDYWTRLDNDLATLRAAEQAANEAVEEAATALDQVVNLPAPSRDDLLRRRGDTEVRKQHAASGLRLWRQIATAEENAERLSGHASRLRAEHRTAAKRPDRGLSLRFGEILADIGYPKLAEPYLDEKPARARTDLRQSQQRRSRPHQPGLVPGPVGDRARARRPRAGPAHHRGAVHPRPGRASLRPDRRRDGLAGDVAVPKTRPRARRR